MPEVVLARDKTNRTINMNSLPFLRLYFTFLQQASFFIGTSLSILHPGKQDTLSVHKENIEGKCKARLQCCVAQGV